jgi:N-acetylmuramoyl-L-alanine amidase
LNPAVPGVLPAIPLVDGPLALRVVYPRERQLIAVKDSTFLLGSVGSGNARLTINGHDVPVNPNGGFLAWLPFPADDPPTYSLVAEKGSDVERRRLVVARPRTPAVPVEPPPLVVPERPTFVELLNSNVDARSEADGVAILRPSIGGTYRWFLHPGTVVQVSGTRGAWTRVTLSDSTDAWVESNLVRPSERRPPSYVALANATFKPTDAWDEFRLPLPDKIPFLIEQRADSFVITFHGVTPDVDLFVAGGRAPVTSEHEGNRVRVTVRVDHPSVGFEALWDNGAFVLRIRRPPTVIRERPLMGKVIGVDAGHPPIGSTGPTGLYEADATLRISLELQRLLIDAGATVVMTRTNSGPVALGARPILARRANVDALVSVHLNALPDGVNPYRTNGTSTYVFHAQSEPLATAVQRGMVRWMGLRDLGVRYDNLALARPTWFPSILCEGAFVILPDQEAALRTEEFQVRYAIGIVEGLENYFRSLIRQ